jgi:acetylornithine deacetylase
MIDEKINPCLLETITFLKELIRIPSLSGKEERAIQFIYYAFLPLTDEIEMVPLSDEIKNDPDYSTPIPDLRYNGRHNLRAVVKGDGGGKSILFNTHADVVPAPKSQFEPIVNNEAVYGRGACDAKGQIATLFLLLCFLKKSGIRLKGDIIIHIIIEEENGGNGTLAAIRKGEMADAAIVMEPSSLKILPSVRGAVWFRVITKGKPGHSGSGGKRISALDLAIEAKEILSDYHKKLLAASRGIPLFDDYENPMPITFGKLHAGDWPATIPNQGILEGVLGFLPNRTRFEVMEEIRQEIQQKGSDELKANFKLEFMYRHDSHVLHVDHPLVKTLSNACQKIDIPPKITAMVASCDSWFYNNQLKIPTVVFGVGDLAVAHSNHEHIKIKDLELASAILFNFLNDWCNQE